MSKAIKRKIAKRMAACLCLLAVAFVMLSFFSANTAQAGFLPENHLGTGANETVTRESNGSLQQENMFEESQDTERKLAFLVLFSLPLLLLFFRVPAVSKDGSMSSFCPFSLHVRLNI